MIGPSSLPLAESASIPLRSHPGLESQFDALLGDPDFLYLQHRDERLNLFRILGRSFSELWHSAFLTWLLDPTSHHGLGDFPLKRFLAAVMIQGIRREGHEPFAPNLTIADIEHADLRHIQFEAERPILNTGTSNGSARIDVYGSIAGQGGVQSDALTPFQVVIEAKVKAREKGEQTKTYFKWAEGMGCNTSVYVFLTLEDAAPPEHPAFIQVHYQALLDRVLLPVLSHPNLSNESKFLVEQYMANLTDSTSGRPMAQGDSDLCEKLYQRHKQVFDSVFIVAKGDVPAPKSGRSPQRYTATLQDLVDAGLIEVGQRLVGRNKQDVWEADLVKENGSILISYVNDAAIKSPNPSRTALELVGRPMNGWAFWEVKGGPANKKRLADLRDEFLNQNAEGPSTI